MRLLFRQVYHRSVPFIASEVNTFACMLVQTTPLKSYAVKILSSLMIISRPYCAVWHPNVYKLKIALLQILTTSGDEFCPVILHKVIYFVIIFFSLFLVSNIRFLEEISSSASRYRQITRAFPQFAVSEASSPANRLIESIYMYLCYMIIV